MSRSGKFVFLKVRFESLVFNINQIPAQEAKDQFKKLKVETISLYNIFPEEKKELDKMIRETKSAIYVKHIKPALDRTNILIDELNALIQVEDKTKKIKDKFKQLKQSASTILTCEEYFPGYAYPTFTHNYAKAVERFLTCYRRRVQNVLVKKSEEISTKASYCVDQYDNGNLHPIDLQKAKAIVEKICARYSKGVAKFLAYYHEEFKANPAQQYFTQSCLDILDRSCTHALEVYNASLANPKPKAHSKDAKGLIPLFGLDWKRVEEISLPYKNYLDEKRFNKTYRNELAVYTEKSKDILRSTKMASIPGTELLIKKLETFVVGMEKNLSILQDILFDKFLNDNITDISLHRPNTAEQYQGIFVEIKKHFQHLNLKEQESQIELLQIMLRQIEAGYIASSMPAEPVQAIMREIELRIKQLNSQLYAINLFRFTNNMSVGSVGSSSSCSSSFITLSST